jgi:hypothetical protein
MNRALLYLYLALLRRRTAQFLLGLRRPTRLIGWAGPLALVVLAFYYRHETFFEQLLKSEVIVGGALLMVMGSLIKGFFQRGLVFSPADVEFLFAGPFTKRHLIFYQLLPNYIFAVFQGLIFAALFGAHLVHPVFFAGCFVLFQIACFHLAAAGALFGGSLSLTVYYRFRWALLAFCFLLVEIYFRVFLEFSLAPKILTSELRHVLFPGTAAPADLAAIRVLREALPAIFDPRVGETAILQPFLALGFGLAVLGTGWLMFRFQGDLLESALAPSFRREAKRNGAGVETKPGVASFGRVPFLNGARSLVWKNFVAAFRSRRQLLLSLAFTAVGTLPLMAILHFYDALIKGTDRAGVEARELYLGVAIFVGLFPFLLQRSLPFDLRLDRRKLLDLRTLPFSPLELVLAELAVPAIFCVAFQALGIGALMIYGRAATGAMSVAEIVGLGFLLAVLYPTVAFGVNLVWNIHYLVSNARPGGAADKSITAVGTLLIVGLSIAVFYPAIWTGVKFFNLTSNPSWALLGFCAVQLIIDALLVLNLARLFRNLEVAQR